MKLENKTPLEVLSALHTYSASLFAFLQNIEELYNNTSSSNQKWYLSKVHKDVTILIGEIERTMNVLKEEIRGIPMFAVVK